MITKFMTRIIKASVLEDSITLRRLLAVVYLHGIGRYNPIFLNENVRISTNISPSFVSFGPIQYKPTYIQVMTWRRAGDKPLVSTNDGLVY